MLTVRDIPFDLPVDSIFDLVISGLPVPEYGTISTFFVALDNDKNPDEVMEFGEIQDVALVATAIKEIIVESFTITDNTWIIKSDQTFKFHILGGNIATNSKVKIDYPNPFIDKFQKKGKITCVANGVALPSCTLIGH